MHPLPISAAAQSGRRIANYGLPTFGVGNPFARRHHTRLRGVCGQCGEQSHSNSSISAISAGKWLAQHVCVAGPWHRCSGRMSEAPAPSHAQRVCIAGLLTPMRWAITRGIARTTGISALGECPRHWYQCQGQARPALIYSYKYLLLKSQIIRILKNYYSFSKFLILK